MRVKAVARYLGLATPSLADPRDTPHWKLEVLPAGAKLAFPNALGAQRSSMIGSGSWVAPTRAQNAAAPGSSGGFALQEKPSPRAAAAWASTRPAPRRRVRRAGRSAGHLRTRRYSSIGPAQRQAEYSDALAVQLEDDLADRRRQTRWLVGPVAVAVGLGHAVVAARIQRRAAACAANGQESAEFAAVSGARATHDRFAGYRRA